MGKSINPMCDFLKPKPQGETMTGSALRLIVLRVCSQLFLGGLHSCIARLRFTGWLPGCTSQPIL
jgi:hypothetical protein